MKRMLIAIYPAVYGLILFALGASSGEELFVQIATAPASWVMMAAATAGGDGVSLVRVAAFVFGNLMLIGWYPFLGYALLASSRRRGRLLFVSAMIFQYMATVLLVVRAAREDALGNLLLNAIPSSAAFATAYLVGQVGLWMIFSRLRHPQRAGREIRIGAMRIVHVTAKPHGFRADGGRVVGPFVLVTPYAWTYHLFHGTELVVFGTTVARHGRWRVVTWHWRKAEARQFWRAAEQAFVRFLGFCEERDLRPEIALESSVLHASFYPEELYERVPGRFKWIPSDRYHEAERRFRQLAADVFGEAVS